MSARKLDAVAGKHAAGQRHPGAVVGRRVEAQREASGLRDRRDSLINEAGGRDQPFDLKPQAREVRSKATGLSMSESEVKICLDVSARLAATAQRWAPRPPLDVFQRGCIAGKLVDVAGLSDHVAEPVAPNPGLTVQPSKSRARNRAPRRLLPSCSFLARAVESYAGIAQTVLPLGKARTLPRSSFSQSAYLVITSRRRSTAVILR